MLKEHPASFEIHDSRDNSSFHIAKQHLDPSTFAKMSQVQKYDSGGDVSGAQSAQDSMRKAFHFDDGGDVPKPPEGKSLAQTASDYFTGMANPAPAPQTRDDQYQAIRDQNSKNMGHAQGGVIQKFRAGGVAQDQDSPNFKAKIAEEEAKGGSGIAGTSAEDRALTDVNSDQQQSIDQQALVDAAKNNPQSLSNSQLASVNQVPGTPTEVAQDNFNPDQEEGVANAAADASTGIKQVSDQTASPVADNSQNQAQQPSIPAPVKINQPPKVGSWEDLMAKQSQALDDLTSPTGSYKTLMDHLMTNKIDPNKYWDGHSKLAASLGIILGGLGQGLMHSNTNQALAVVQDGINREVDRQSKNNANEMDLLKMNNGNKLATINQLSTMAQATLAKQAQQINNPLVTAQVQALNQQIEQNKMQMQIRSNALDFLKNPQSAQGDTQSPINYSKWQALKNAGLLSNEQDAAVTKEATTHMNLVNQMQVANKAFDEAGKEKGLMTIPEKLGFKPTSEIAFDNAMGPFVKDQEGRPSPELLKQAYAFKPEPYDPASRVAAKKAAFNQWAMSRNATPTLDYFGIKNNTPMNPNQMVAGQNGIQYKNGKPYKKVAGGWVPVNAASNIVGQ